MTEEYNTKEKIEIGLKIRDKIFKGNIYNQQGVIMEGLKALIIKTSNNPTTEELQWANEKITELNNLYETIKVYINEEELRIQQEKQRLLEEQRLQEELPNQIEEPVIEDTVTVEEPTEEQTSDDLVIEENTEELNNDVQEPVIENDNIDTGEITIESDTTTSTLEEDKTSN